MERKTGSKANYSRRSDDGNRGGRKTGEKPLRSRIKKAFEGVTDREPAHRAAKPRFDRDEKPRFGEEKKPRFGREVRPRFGREERPRRTTRPGSEEKPRRASRFASDEESPRKYSRRTEVRSSFPGRPLRKKQPAATQEKEAATEVRLNKYIANSGVCSRREADTYIQTGLVTVNGRIVTELGTKVRTTDDIRFNGERLHGERKVYILMNKPKDFVTTLSDPHAERTVMDLISSDRCPERVYPVGRLDKATTGVLLFTNDGELTEKLTHPSHKVKKIYQVTLDKPLTQNDFNRIVEGLELEDGPIAADTLAYTNDEKTEVGIEIHSGRNRIVRRIFESLDYKVKKLDRVVFAGLTKKNVRRGEWRFLEESEVIILKMGAGK